MNVHTPEEDKPERIEESDKSDQSLSAAATTTINTAGGSAITGTVNAGGDVIGRDRIEQHFHYHGTSQPATHNSPRGIFGQYPFNQHFFGRDDELTELHTLLRTQKQVNICPVITGMGGLGKTQLAAHYARRHTADYPDGIFWVTAADLNAIRGQLADFCVALGLPVADPQRSGDLSEQKISAFKHYLNDHSNTLLIFDNVDEPDYLRTRQIGAGVTVLTLGGKLIVTTRRRKLSGDRFVELALQRLLPAPARQILLTARPDLESDPDLDRLCEQFGYLPLMLNLAAAALKKRGGAIVGYLQRLQKLGAEKLHSEVAKVSLDDYHKSLTVVLHEQWSMLTDENARLLFRVAGQLPEAAVILNARLGLLAGLADVDEWERPLNDALDELEHASLVEQSDGKAVRLHPLVRDFADGLTERTQRNSFRVQCAQHLADAYANNQTDMQRLGMEYAARGIAEILFDLITALELAQVDSANHQSLISKLQARLRHLHLEAHHLHGPSTTWQPERFWQQMLPRTPLFANQALTNQLCRLLQHKVYWVPRWGHQRQSLSLEQTLNGHKHGVAAVAMLDANRIVSASDDGTLKVWNLHSSEVEQTFSGHKGQVSSVAKLDTNRIVSASIDGTLKVWNLHNSEVEKTLNGLKGMITSMAVLDANHIILASVDSTLNIWNLHCNEVEQILSEHGGQVSNVAVLDANRIALASNNGTIKVWNRHSGEVEQILSGHRERVTSIVLLDANCIVSASFDGTLKVWNLHRGEVERTLIGHENGVRGVAVLDANRIVSASDDRTLKIWNLHNGEVEQTLIGHENGVAAVAMLDANRIVSASFDGALKVWNLYSSEVKRTLSGHEDRVSSMAVLDANRIVSASDDRTLKVWNLHSGEVEQALSGHGYGVNSVAVLDANRIVSASDDHTLKIWNLYSSEVEKTLSGHEDSVRGIAVLDVNSIVSASGDGTLKVWNLHSGEVEQIFSSHKCDVSSVAVLDANHIVSALDERALKVWNLRSGEIEQTLSGSRSSVLCVTVLDANRIVLASYDGTLKVWNLHRGEVEQTLRGHKSSVLSVEVLDANCIISASEDHTLKVWNLHTSTVISSIALDGALQCVVVVRQTDHTLVVAGDAAGALYCLELVMPKK